VIYGAHGIPVELLYAQTYMDSSTGLSITGSSGTYTGAAVAGVGDVNADGYNDILITAAFQGNGEAYIIYGGIYPGQSNPPSPSRSASHSRSPSPKGGSGRRRGAIIDQHEDNDTTSNKSGPVVVVIDDRMPAVITATTTNDATSAGEQLQPFAWYSPWSWVKGFAKSLWSGQLHSDETSSNDSVSQQQLKDIRSQCATLLSDLKHSPNTDKWLGFSVEDLAHDIDDLLAAGASLEVHEETVSLMANRLEVIKADFLPLPLTGPASSFSSLLSGRQHHQAAALYDSTPQSLLLHAGASMSGSFSAVGAAPQLRLM